MKAETDCIFIFYNIFFVSFTVNNTKASHLYAYFHDFNACITFTEKQIYKISTLEKFLQRCIWTAVCSTTSDLLPYLPHFSQNEACWSWSVWQFGKYLPQGPSSFSLSSDYRHKTAHSYWLHPCKYHSITT